MAKNMVKKTSRNIIYLVFFFSGVAGLIYQIVWTRLLYLIFGVSTQSVVSVTSAFMAGLAIGSYLSGRLAIKQKNILKIYALLEFGIGLTSIFLPYIFNLINNFYFFIYHLPGLSDFSGFLWTCRFVLTFVAILIPTSAMGATLPVIIEFIQRYFKSKIEFETGLLYAINTFGAFLGVILSGFVFIELLGLQYTMWLAIIINITLGIIVWQMSKKKFINKTIIKTSRESQTLSISSLGLPTKIAIIIFAFSGLISMVYEIAWIRLLTPITGTFIYAFSFILALILFGIALGSFLTKLIFSKFKSPILMFSIVEFAIGIGAMLSVLATTELFKFSTFITELIVILPTTVAMGMTFPTVMRLTPAKVQGSTFAGFSYMFNTVGSMIGPMIGGFIFLPLLGSSSTVLILSCLNLTFSVILALCDLSVKRFFRMSFVFCTLGLIFILINLLIKHPAFFTEKTRKSLETYTKNHGYVYQYKEDETASVMAYMSSDRKDSGLLVDGIGMTALVDETKIMAHLPILLHPNPKDMLIICFGMGTTFRSALTYDINVDAVELIPSVPKMFPIFFSDAQEVLKNPRGKIIINDGRNYVRLTNKKYDIIQVDPPPPVNAAGTTILYSQDFYQDSKQKLKENGLFIQWIFFGSKEEDISMLVRSFLNVFPNVMAFNSPSKTGLYLVGSLKPIKINILLARQRLKDNPKALDDLNEWGSWNADSLLSLYYGNQNELIQIVADTPAVTDMFPRTEYYLLRHNFKK